MRVPFNQIHIGGQEIGYIQRALANQHLSGHGPFTRTCQDWLQGRLGGGRTLLTHSATAALEMCALLADLGPGDEVIMPSFTFVTTATAFVLRGAVPVFVDIRPDTQNLDETRIEAAVTERTRAIVAVHYAGVAAEMDAIQAVARRHGLLVIEDAAQAILSEYHDRPLASIGDLAAISFHETKNLHSGEGGALVINRPDLAARAEILWEKGTNRSQFLNGQVDKYTWVDLGSSFQPGEMTAAFLLAQLEDGDAITAQRLKTWHDYHAAFADLERDGRLHRPAVPAGCRHNGHIYYLLLPSRESRSAFIDHMRRHQVDTLFHYVPLHSAPAGQRFGRSAGTLANTQRAGDTLVRLPLWRGMGARETAHVIDVATVFFRMPATLQAGE